MVICQNQGPPRKKDTRDQILSNTVLYLGTLCEYLDIIPRNPWQIKTTTIYRQA